MAYHAAARSLKIAGCLLWACSQIAQAGVNVWTTHGPEIGSVFQVVFDPVHSGTVYAGTSLGFFKSVDGGKSWANPSTGLGRYFILSLALAPGGTTIYAGTSGTGVFKSVDAGEHWNPSYAGMTSYEVTAVAVDPRDPKTVYAGTSGIDYEACEGSCFFKTTDAGRSWRGIPTVPVPPNPDIRALTVDPSTPGTLYAASFGSGVLKSADGGATWKILDTGSSRLLVYALALDPSSPATLYAATYDAGLLKSTDSGLSWRRLPLPSGVSGLYVRSVAVDPGGSRTVYAVFGAAVFRSRDGGETWAPMSAGLGGSNVYGLAIDPADPSRLFAASANGVLEYEISEPCAPGPASLCLSGGRFEVSARWSSSGGGSGTGRAKAISGVAGYFTFFDASNVELLVKVVDGCGFNGHFWTFAGGLTNLGVVLTVRDTQTGAVKVYFNPPNSPFETIQDTSTFPCSANALSSARVASSTGTAPPPPIASDRFLETTSRDAGPCVADGVSLCLNDARYRVTARWTAPDGSTGDARPLTLTADAGAFWFFTPENPELVVKVLDGCGVNSRSWVFAAGLTNVEVVLTVTDTQTGLVRLYVNRQGTPFQPIQDTDAFTNCP